MTRPIRGRPRLAKVSGGYEGETCLLLLSPKRRLIRARFQDGTEAIVPEAPSLERRLNAEAYLARRAKRPENVRARVVRAAAAHRHKRWEQIQHAVTERLRELEPGSDPHRVCYAVAALLRLVTMLAARRPSVEENGTRRPPLYLDDVRQLVKHMIGPRRGPRAKEPKRLNLLPHERRSARHHLRHAHAALRGRASVAILLGLLGVILPPSRRQGVGTASPKLVAKWRNELRDAGFIYEDREEDLAKALGVHPRTVRRTTRRDR